MISIACFYFSPHLYVAFWSLTMYDLHVPVERYEAEKNKMNDLLNNLDENKELVISCVIS